MSSRKGRRFVRRYLFPLVEGLWLVGWDLVGRALRPERFARPWSAAGGGHVVVVAPHPDDETAGAGGAIALHVRAGDRVTVVVVTDGGASRAGGLPAAEIVRRRAAEVEAAVATLGAHSLIRLDLPEGRWRPDTARAALAALLEDARIVYAPSSVDYHPEHVSVARVLAGLLRPEQIVRVYELGVPLTPVLANLVADIRAVAPLKDRALAAFATQSELLAALRRIARYHSRLYKLPAVELFWELPAERYASVITASPWPGHPGPFRGIRSRPLSDPLAALAGLSVRRSLRSVAASPTPSAGH